MKLHSGSHKLFTRKTHKLQKKIILQRKQKSFEYYSRYGVYDYQEIKLVNIFFGV